MEENRVSRTVLALAGPVHVSGPFVAAVAIVVTLTLCAAAGASAERLVVGDGFGSPLSHVQAIAEAKGYSEPGLEIEWMRFPTGAALVEGIAAGKIQMGIAGDTPAMALTAGGAPAKIVGKQTDSSLAYALYARQDLNIRKPEDLYGKTIGFTFGSQAQGLWISILDAQKLDASKIKTVNLSPSGLQAAYERGEIDGYVLWQPSAYVISRIRPTIRLEDPAKSYFPDSSRALQLNGYYTVVVARDEVIRDKPELLKSFLRLVDKTNKFISANQVEAANIIAKSLKVDPAAMQTVLEQTKHDMTVDDRFIKDMEAQANQLYAQGRFRAKPPTGLKSWLDFSSLQQAFPAYVTLTR